MKTRVAVVGSGFGLYGQLPAFQRIPDCEVVGIAGKNTDRLVNYCRQTNVPVFTDWRTMLDQARPEAIAIAVVPSHQYEIADEALNRGISVFAEKPLALNLAQAAALLEKARVKKVAHMVDFLFPEIPEWRQLKQLIESPALGQLAAIHAMWFFRSYDVRNNVHGWKSRPEEGGGAVSFYLSHALHNLEFLGGRIQSLECLLNHDPDAPGSGETSAELKFKLLSGRTQGAGGTIRFDCANSGFSQHSWEIIGTRGSFILKNASASFTSGFELTSLAEGLKIHNPQSAIRNQDPSVDERVPLVQSLAERFIAWHRGGPPARPDFSDGVRVQHLIESARSSAKVGGTVNTLDVVAHAAAGNGH